MFNNIATRFFGVRFFSLILGFTALAGGFHSAYADEAAYPYPKNKRYPFGVMPSNRQDADASASYTTWTSQFVTSEGAGGFQRVLGGSCRDSATNCTVSEGIGYGMLLAVNHNDQPLFDDLLGYFKLQKNANGLMSWRIAADGSVLGDASANDINAATDGDEDIAFALVLADMQWGNQEFDYRQDAIDLINSIMTHAVEPDTYVLKPGDVWGGSDITNPSYFAPAYYRAFQTVTGDTRWTQVLNKSYDILDKAANPVTGMVPNWCSADGTEVSGWGYDFGYDAVRTPLRIAMDYLWYGEPRAQAFVGRLATFVSGVGIVQIKDGYTLDGTLTGEWHNSTFVSSLAASTLAASSQELADKAYTESVDVQGDNYFSWSLRSLVLLLQTGNWLYPNVQYTVTMTTTGDGYVHANPPDVNCEKTYSTTNNSGTSLTLTAIPSTDDGTVVVWGGACANTPGVTCTLTMDAAKDVTVNFVAPPHAVLSLISGWNLVGNSTHATLDIVSLLADPASIISVWKWEAAIGKWAMYTPSMQGQELIDYTDQMGYKLLTTIEAGEGFWINARSAVGMTLPAGDAMLASDYAPGQTNALTQGWKLISVGEQQTPAQFNSASGNKINTLWAWDIAQKNWYFYAPSLAQTGTLTNYIARLHYLDFAEGKTLDPGLGFWVNLR